MKIIESYLPSSEDAEISHDYSVWGKEHGKIDLTFYDYNYRLFVYGDKHKDYTQKFIYSDRYLKIIFFIYGRV